MEGGAIGDNTGNLCYRCARCFSGETPASKKKKTEIERENERERSAADERGSLSNCTLKRKTQQIKMTELSSGFFYVCSSP